MSLRSKKRSRRIEIKIFKYLFEKKEASGYEIAKKIREPISSVYYCLNKLKDRNIVVELEENYYGLNPVFFSRDFWDKTIASLKQILQTMQESEAEMFKPPDSIYALGLIAEMLLEH